MHHGPHGATAARHRRRPTRREFGAWLAAATAGLAITAGCEVGGPWARPAKVPRIGYLGSDSRPGYERFAALERGLRELGLRRQPDCRHRAPPESGSDRRGLRAHGRRAGRAAGRRHRHRGHAVGCRGGACDAHRSDCRGRPASQPARPRAVENLARPGRNVTGLDVDLGLEAKRLELLHQVVPGGPRLGHAAQSRHPRDRRTAHPVAGHRARARPGAARLSRTGAR